MRKRGNYYLRITCVVSLCIGFWIVAGIYGLIFLIFIVFRRPIDRNFERHFMEMIKRKNK